MGFENFLKSDNERLNSQLKFSSEIDKMTDIIRRTYLVNGKRLENDAEHSWHIAVMAQLFKEYSLVKVDVGRVVKMCVVHDLVEIYAGDTYAYDEKGNESKLDREMKAADKLFSILPSEQAFEMRNLWEEFDKRETNDAKYAACMDSLQPFLHNTLTGGKAWMENGAKRVQVEKRMSIIKKVMPEVYKWIELNIERASSNNWLS